jgi:hypothetical protein
VRASAPHASAANAGRSIRTRDWAQTARDQGSGQEPLPSANRGTHERGASCGTLAVTSRANTVSGAGSAAGERSAATGSWPARAERPSARA